MQLVVRNNLFRTAIKSAALMSCVGLTARTLELAPATTRSLYVAAGLLGILTAVLAVLTLRAPSPTPTWVRLLAPDPSRVGEILHVLSFFTFSDPGEVSWHAVEQARGGNRPKSVATSMLLYAVLALPTTVMLDWLFARGGPRLSLAAIYYFVPWTILRVCEERARRARHADS